MTTRRKIALGFGIVLALGFLCLLAEHLRGKWALARLEKELRAKGEKFSVDELRPARGHAEDNAAFAFLRAEAQLRNVLVSSYNYPSAMHYVAPGKVETDWVKEQWLAIDARRTNKWVNWVDFASDLEANRPHLEELRELIHRPVLDFGVQYSGFLELLPHLAKTKSVANWLRSDALLCLREKNLAGAVADIEAIAELGVRQKEERLVISLLVARAESMIGLYATWAALSAPGWTDEQLAALQAAWRPRGLVAAMGLSLEMERARQIKIIDRVRAGDLSLNALDQLYDFSGMSGGPAPPPPASVLDQLEQMVKDTPEALARFFGEHIVYPVWRFAWADQAKHHYLQKSQIDITAARELSQGKPWNTVSLAEKMSEESFYGGAAFHDLVRAVFTRLMLQTRTTTVGKAQSLEVFRELAVTAIALKRYQLRHGRPAPGLEALVPEFLPQLPVDAMNGQPLHYRLKDDGAFLLYSVGQNGVDDGGDPTPVSGESKSHPPRYGDFQNGRDLVWPQPATAQEIADFEAKEKKK